MTGPRIGQTPVAVKRWSDDEIATLDDLRARGLSYTQIARKLPARSRCAVVGFDWRRRQA